MIILDLFFFEGYNNCCGFVKNSQDLYGNDNNYIYRGLYIELFISEVLVFGKGTVEGWVVIVQQFEARTLVRGERLKS